MGQAKRRVPEDPALSAGARSIGTYLAGQRRLRGLSLDDLEELTRIPRRSLARLEAGAYDGQADGFVRGFVRTVAAALGLDPVETVTRMLEEPAETGPAAPARLWSARTARWAAWAIGALLLLGLASWGGRALSLLGAHRSGPEIVIRTDPVRALAAEVGRLSPSSSPGIALPASGSDSPRTR